MSIIKRIKNRGIFGTIKYVLKRAFGLVKIERELETLNGKLDTVFYFLNNLTDISKMPKAEGELRDLQLCDYQLLRIFDKVCSDNNWDYWLDFGTLLGAVRHKGFIPWDDVDVTVPRDVYEDMCKKLPGILAKYGIDACECDKMARIGIGYKHKETGAWIDVFPCDAIRADNRRDVQDKVHEWQRCFGRKCNKLDVGEFKKLKNNYFDFSTDESSDKLILSVMEFLPDSAVRIHNFDCVYPIKRIQFEDSEFCVPCGYEEFLTDIYGNYMEYPKCDLSHHGDDIPIYKWAERSGTNMHDVYSELKQIADNK